MKTYVKKVSHTILIGLIILLIITVIYLVIPKYQIQSVRVDDDTVLITKINTLTGQTDTIYKSNNTFLNKYRN